MHLKITLDILQTSLTLSYNEENALVIEQSLRIYKAILGLSSFSSAKIEEPIDKLSLDQETYQQIIKNMSLIFSRRASISIYSL